jgi:carboxymethylenebutenolidase
MPDMNTYQRYLIEEFAEEYQERRMSRRDLLRRAALIMGSGPAGLAALAAVGCDTGADDDDEPTPEASATATATTAAETPSATAEESPSATAEAEPTPEADILADDITISGPASDLYGYLARPFDDAIHPGILVIHENRGLVEHIRDVTQRYATEGFIALAVDLVSRNGGSTGDEAANTGFLGSSSTGGLVADLQAYIAYLQERDGVLPGGVGVTGFCFGGGYTWEITVASDRVRAAAPYYGPCRVIDELPDVSAAVFAVYAENDDRVTGDAEDVRDALEASGQPFEVTIYPGDDHAFFNDTGGRYNAEAADDAWERTLAWFREHLA